MVMPVRQRRPLQPGEFRADIIPAIDLDYQGDDFGQLRLGKDILPMIAMMTMQTPNGPRVVQGNGNGSLPVSNPSIDVELIDATPDNPATANSFNVVPVGFEWEIIAGRMQYIASANVGARNVVFFIVPPNGGSWYSGLPPVTQPQSTSFLYSLIPNVRSAQQVTGTLTENYVMFPQGLRLPAGSTILWRDTLGIDYPGDVASYHLLVAQRKVSS